MNRSLRFLVALVAATTALAACAGYAFPGGFSSAGTGTVAGRVLAVPCAPIERAGTPCQGRPVTSADITFTSEATHDAVTTRTDSAGNYSVQLAGGAWGVSFKGVMRLISGPKSVVVQPGKTLIANFVVDSGIRLPAVAAASS